MVDKKLADQLPRLSPKRAYAATRRLAIEADPAGAVRRAGNAREAGWYPPAPDTMTILSALLPCEQGVAAYAALHRTADAAIASGDGRSRGQIMVDTLVERLTGQAAADAVSAEIGLVMTDAALFAGGDTAADLTGYGPIPADLAREIAGGAGDRAAQPGEAETRAVARARIFLRRLFTDPATGSIEDCDPRRRRFDGVLARAPGLPGSALPRSVLRRPDPAPGPHSGLRRRRTHHHRERPRGMPARQLRPPDAGVLRPAH